MIVMLMRCTLAVLYGVSWRCYTGLRGGWLAGSIVILVIALAMGVALIWDIQRLASRMREGVESGPLGGLHKRLPSWTYRAFGIWCVLFGCGQFAYFFAITHH